MKIIQIKGKGAVNMKRQILILLVLFTSIILGDGMVKPQALKYGDTIGIIAPANYSGASADTMVKDLEARGFKVVLGDSFYSKWYNFGGSDEIRAKDINNMFKNKEVKAIFCVRGGYGSIRLLDLIDFDTIRKNPKIFVGYSDITTLLMAITQKTGLVTFHGPMSSNYTNFDDITRISFFDTIMTDKDSYVLSDYLGADLRVISSGKAEGEIVGGNLSLIVASLGTKYEIDTKGKILFIEEVGEYTYRVDRMFQQLKLAGKFDDASGIILGSFTKANQEAPEDMPLQEVFYDSFGSLKKPVVSNFSSGHMRPFITVPIGAKAKMNTDTGKIEIVGGTVK